METTRDGRDLKGGGKGEIDKKAVVRRDKESWEKKGRKRKEGA